MAQGPVAVGGFVAEGEGETITKGVPTSDRIANSAIVERELNFEFSSLKRLRLSLRNPDMTTAQRVGLAINAFLGETVAKALDPATIFIEVPEEYKGNLVGLLTEIEQLRVDPDIPARVVIDESNGIIVIGDQVRVSTVAIAQGNLTIRISETPQVSQPAPFAEKGETKVVARSEIQIDEGEDNKLTVLNASVTLQQLVDGLNALGIGPRDMISILQSLKAAGALQAEFVVM